MGVSLSRPCWRACVAGDDEASLAHPDARDEVLTLVAAGHLAPVNVVQLSGASRQLRRALEPERQRLAIPAHLTPVARSALTCMLPTLPNMAAVAAATEMVTAIPAGYACIPAGSFIMGPAEDDADGMPWEHYLEHPVTLSRPFLLKTTPMTQGEYRALMGVNPSHFTQGEDADARPVERVTYFQALACCNKMSEREKLPPYYDLGDWDGAGEYLGSDVIEHTPRGRGYRLPTEAEWEYAARARSTSARYGDVDAIAWYWDNADDTTHPVGQKQPSAWGLYDMLGNVAEWVWDRYDPFVPSTVQHDPAGPEAGVYRERVARGAGWTFSHESVRAALRIHAEASVRSDCVGFRPARTIAWA